MPLLDVVDETFVVAPPNTVRTLWCDEGSWDERFTDLTLRCYEDRGRQGKRWFVTGALVGTAEVWLEEVGDGVLVHVYIRADLAPAYGGPILSPRKARRVARQLRKKYARPLKKWGFVIKDAAEDGNRRPGEPSARARRPRVVSPARTASTPQESRDGRPNHQ